MNNRGIGRALAPSVSSDRAQEAMDRARRQQAMLKSVFADARLGLFREWLLDGVTHVSALVPLVLRVEERDRSTAMGLLRPTPDWPTPRWSLSKHSVRRHAQSISRAFALSPYGRVNLCDHLYPVDRIRLEVVKDTVELALEQGRCGFATRGGTGILRVPTSLPEAVAAGCIGRPLEEVVDFPLLVSRGFLVERTLRRTNSTFFSFPVESLPIAAWPDAVLF